MTARVIQFFAPGIPQVYYVGMLAGENDHAAVEATGEGREINRHNFTLDEIDAAMKKNVVQRLLKLIEFRNEYDAFNGEFEVLDVKENELQLSWKKDEKQCLLSVDLGTSKSVISYIDEDGEVIQYKI